MFFENILSAGDQKRFFSFQSSFIKVVGFLYSNYSKNFGINETKI